MVGATAYDDVLRGLRTGIEASSLKPDRNLFDSNTKLSDSPGTNLIAGVTYLEFFVN